MPSNTKKTETVKTVEVKKPDKTASEKSGVFVYLGPTIRGVISHATIYSGKRTDVLASLAETIALYPSVERLIVEDSEIVAAKKKIKEGGNLLSIAYSDLTKI